MSKRSRILHKIIAFSVLLASFTLVQATPCGLDCIAAQAQYPGETTCYCVFCGMCSADPTNPDLEIYYENGVEQSRRCAYYPQVCGYTKVLPLVMTR